MKVRTHAVAQTAYKCVVDRRNAMADKRKADDQQEVGKERYGALAHSLPGMILENGLAQTTGFLLAKGKPEHHAVLEDLRAVLHAAGATTANDGRDFHQEVTGAGLDRTLNLTRRSLEAGGWLKRYAQGVLGVDATGKSTADDSPDGEG